MYDHNIIQRRYYMLSLKTDRLVIREMTKNDFDDYFRICHQPEVHPYVPHISDNYDIEYARFVSYIQMVYGFYGFGMWLVFDRKTGKLAGRAGIDIREIDGRSCYEIGYIIAKEFRHKGYAHEVCSEIIMYAFGKLGFDELFAVMDRENTASVKTAEGLGFTRISDDGKYYIYNRKRP